MYLWMIFVATLGTVGTQELVFPTTEPPSCESSGEAFYRPTGRCEELLKRGPCPPKEWLVLDRTTALPTCRRRPCPKNYAFSKGRCYSRRDTSLCEPGEVIYNDIHGGAACDCQPGKVYWPADSTCYDLLYRGPCSFENHLVMDGNDVICAQNPCVADGYVKLGDTCYQLHTQGPCQSGVLHVDPTTLDVSCADIDQRVVVDVPLLDCAPGSKRDVLGVCRVVRNERTQRRRTIPRRCPPGYFRDARGRCRQPPPSIVFS